MNTYQVTILITIIQEITIRATDESEAQTKACDAVFNHLGINGHSAEVEPLECVCLSKDSISESL